LAQIESLFFPAKGDTLNIQIFGTLKCQDTKKAQRYFKERRISFQFINLMERGLSKGELNSVRNAVGGDELIDRESKEYARLNLKYINHDPEEEALRHPLILKTPVVRNGNLATAGYAPEVWKTWE
jgi:arsenate reductase (glutaredoxin)